MRTTPTNPATIGISLPAKWIPSLNEAMDLARDKNPRCPDEELLQSLLVAGILVTLQHALEDAPNA